MKRTAITGLLITAALLASPVFADEDLCTANLQKISDTLATAGATSEGLDKSVATHVEDAKKAQAAGNDKDCIAITSKVIERLEKTEKGGQ
ncbi:hypothetical protein [Pseudomonas alkylphenolica]|uniref:Secreted protein n=1 Tax=Pseudomonas alkylphenolica TaxID=237609 RepID=A0A077F3E3_9PSED|nr:hypothetical protein [Pseudomonas alkylphenolica]AIL59938.1 hypothetical protein PSAKL28_07040 [Pseudomonas alkylphenolica]